jgi:hypothetical protein
MGDITLWAERMMGFYEAAPRLRIRVYADAWLDENEFPPFDNELYPGLHGVALLDLPDRAIPVTHEHLEAWGDRALTADAVLSRALEQSLSLETFTERRRDGDVEFLLVRATSHIYTSAHALRPERHLPDLGPAGAVVALPARDVVVIHELRRGKVEPTLATLGPMVRSLHDASSVPLSSDLFWYQGPKLRARRIGSSADSSVIGVVASDVVAAIAAAADPAEWS